MLLPPSSCGPTQGLLEEGFFYVPAKAETKADETCDRVV